MNSVARRQTLSSRAFFRVFLATESSSEVQTSEPPATEETLSHESVETNETARERYRTNRLLPKTTFLFPAKPRTETKHLHLRALRRSRFSTVACLQESKRKCAWCGTQANDRGYFCHQCNKMLPVNRCQNLFQIFDLNATFDIDLSELEAKYKSMQMKLHPDRFAGREQLEQDFATAQATAINRAYFKLKDPLSRAKHLLSLMQFKFDEEQTISDPELLMEMLEVQERVADASGPEEVAEVIAETVQNKTSLQQELSLAFQQRNLEKASQIVIELSYLQRVLENAKDKM